MNTGLVLEGGAMRGLFTAGVMDVMLEHDIVFDGIIGVSAGAAFGCNYKSRQPGRVIRYNTRFARDSRYCSVKSLLTTGDIFGGEFCYHYMPKYLDFFDEETFRNNPVPFYVVCTDIVTGQTVYRQVMNTTREDYEWIRASASMPLCSRIVKIGEQKLLDGGMADSIPLRFFQDNGFQRNVVILTQPKDYIKKPNRALPLIRCAYRKYPQLVRVMAERHQMYNQETIYVAQEEERGTTLVIRPDRKLPIGHLCHNPEQMREVYDIGRMTGEREISKIAHFIGKKEGE